jgi:DNA integrity scanning protein DisA with diadenylate cyclase activity
MKKADRRRVRETKQTSSEVLLQSASRILGGTNAEAIMVYADSLPGPETIKCLSEDVPVILVTRGSGIDIQDYVDIKAAISVPDYSFTRVDQIKLAIIVGLIRGVLKPGQKIVCLTGVAGKGNIDTLMVLEIGTEFEIFGGHAGEFASSGTNPEVVVRMIDLATKLSVEGREGKPIGTCLVAGDEEKVLSYAKQMTLNPFRGYSEAERNIISPELEETIKEFASIDGAFIIRGDGVILTAGAYLQPPGSDKELEPGLGARHAAAAATTEATDALVVVLSESTGTVRLYRHGGVVMAIERPKPPS